MQHAVKHVTSKDALDDVGTVKTVHAVCAHHAGLKAAGFNPSIIVSWHFDATKVALRIDSVPESVHDGVGLVHLHALCLAVIVKVDIVKAVKLLAARARLDRRELLVGKTIGLSPLLGHRDKSLGHLLVRLLDLQLSSLVVDQVDEVVVAVDADLLLKVLG